MSMTSTRTHTVCDHPSDDVVADILQGDGQHGEPKVYVRWCRICGAVGYGYGAWAEGGEVELRRPEER